MVILDGLRIFLSAVFILFLPGFVWSFVFFFKSEIDWVERIGLSAGLSIALVTLTVFWLNWLFDVTITLVNTIATVCVLAALPVAYLMIRRPSLRAEAMGRVKALARVAGLTRLLRRR